MPMRVAWLAHKGKAREVPLCSLREKGGQPRSVPSQKQTRMIFFTSIKLSETCLNPPMDSGLLASLGTLPQLAH